jgi:tetratricopeptide (TPR) repeat protein
MTNAKVGQFPWPHWSDTSKGSWVEDIIAWFEANYERRPQPEMARQTMMQLLDHIFETVQNSRGGDVYRKQIMKLGNQLKDNPLLGSSVGLEHPYHRRIMRLLELDLQSRHSHMFVLPQIRKKALLEIPDYSALLLAAKLHQAGEYEEAIEIALGIAGGCSLAQYIIGQSERKHGSYEKAHAHLDEGLKLLDQQPCVCPFGEKGVAICDEHLLRAVIFRAKAVVFRRQEDFEEAEKFYAKAEESADRAMQAVSSSAVTSSEAHQKSEDTIWVEQGDENAVRIVAEVAADVHFSHGYYWYQRKNYDRAEDLFSKAISALAACRRGTIYRLIVANWHDS